MWLQGWQEGFVQSILQLAGLLGCEGQVQGWCLSSLHLQPSPVPTRSRPQDQWGERSQLWVYKGLQTPAELLPHVTRANTRAGRGSEIYLGGK